MNRFWNKLRAVPRTLAFAGLAITIAIGSAIGQNATVGVGSIVSHLTTSVTTNSTLISAQRSILMGADWSNSNANAASTVYLKLYDKATAPVCGTDPVKITRAIPAGVSPVAPLDLINTTGVIFNNGIGACVTTLIADSDTTNASAGVAVNVYYQYRPGQ